MNILLIANSENPTPQKLVDGFESLGHRVFLLSINRHFGLYTKYSKNVVVVKYLNWVSGLFYFLFKKKIQEYNLATSSFFHPYRLLNLINYLYLLLFVNKVYRNTPAKIDMIFSWNLQIGGVLAGLIKSDAFKLCHTIGQDLIVYKFPDIDYFFGHKKIIQWVIKNNDLFLGGEKRATEPSLAALGVDIKDPKIVYYGGHFGIDTNLFNPQLRNAKIRRELYSINEKSILAVCFRQPRPQFDFERLIVAVAEVNKRGRDMYFAIGTGNADVSKLKSVAVNLNIQDKIIFVPHISYDRLPEYLAQGDVYLDPINVLKYPDTEKYGISGSVFEAMSCGVFPILNSRFNLETEMPKIVRDFSFKDSADLVEKIMTAINHVEQNENIRNELHGYIKENMSWQRYLKFIENLYKERKTTKVA